MTSDGKKTMISASNPGQSLSANVSSSYFLDSTVLINITDWFST